MNEQEFIEMQRRAQLETTVKLYFAWLQDVTGCPVEKEIEENVRSFSFNSRTYEARRELVAILSSINIQHFNEAYIRCDSLCREWFSDGEIRIKNDTDADAYEQLGRQYCEAAGYIKAFNEYKKSYYPKLLEAYRSTGLLDDENNVTLENVGEISLELETLEQKSAITDYLHIYTLKQGSQPIDYTKPFIVKDVIVCSDSLDYLLTATKSTEDDDDIHISIAVKIEPIIDYSYFLIFVQQRDSVILVTDQMEFANPHTAISSRNPRRRSEGREENTGLPYRIIDDIITWRDEETTLVKEGMVKQELYVKKLSEYMKGASRLALMKVISNMIKRLSNEATTYPQIGTFETMLHEQKLIGTAIDTESESFNDSFEHHRNEEKIKEYYDSYIMPEETKETLPAPIVRDLQTVEEYRGDVLVTAENAKKMADYFVAKREADAKSKTIWDYYEEHEAEEKYELAKLLAKHREHILPYIFSGEEVFILDVKNNDSGITNMFSSDERNEIIGRLSQIHRGTKAEEHSFYMDWGKIYPSDVLRPSGRGHIFNEKCCNGDAKVRRKGVLVWFRHYEFMTALLGIKRTDLPQIYRNYMSCSYVPYIGNSITSNINPKYLVRDPMSEHKPNGVPVYFPYCGNCIRKYLKEYKKFERSLIIYNSEKKEIVDIVDYDAYKAKKENKQ